MASTKDTYTRVIGRLGSGCMGLSYTYFSQGEIDSDHWKKNVQILGDFQNKDRDPWKGGICFGLSVLYLAFSTPKGRRTWTTQQAILDAFNDAIQGKGKLGSLMMAIAHAFVRQSGASVIDKSRVQTQEDLLKAEQAFLLLSKVGLDRYKMSDDGDDKHATCDQLLANFALYPDPPPDDKKRKNLRSFDLELADGSQFLIYKCHFGKNMDAFISFIAEKNTFSLITYEIPFVGGHAMAAVGGSSGFRFFDPNFGVMSCTLNSGMKHLLSRYLPFLYCWGGVDAGNDQRSKDSTKFGYGQEYHDNGQNWNRTNLTLYVSRYRALG